ncbi:hypothetical protein HM1_2034 [Heliomicrobium modesticaldum Ice1]|uniref:Uncharacterized protein n=1 Tax=Heliobacterium modesticaldum (strain ATCC 51547 / Ice1) TaxID=498761 RepID=B0TG95_HELMI|nr:hypothetical protein HM1_2034 [Heliomicrobium modesticaldum Ice1]
MRCRLFNHLYTNQKTEKGQSEEKDGFIRQKANRQKANKADGSSAIG